MNPVVSQQGHCGSCWAFSIVGAIEGQYFRETGKLIPFSEQNLVDCVSQLYPYCGDCGGCHLSDAYEYIQFNGINKASDYPTPYQAEQGICRSNISSAIMINNYHRIPKGDEGILKEAIAAIGPISVSIDSRHDSFHFYSSGVYYEPECDSYDLHHAVLVVGYGITDHGQEYYIGKNSWGDGWGEDGYFKIARNRSNHCGIATGAVYPIL